MLIMYKIKRKSSCEKALLYSVLEIWLSLETNLVCSESRI